MHDSHAKPDQSSLGWASSVSGGTADSVADIFERQAKERQIEAGGDKKSEEFKKSVVALVPQQEIEPETPPEP